MGPPVLMGLMDTPVCVLLTSQADFAGTVNKADLYDFVKSLPKGFYITDVFVLSTDVLYLSLY